MFEQFIALVRELQEIEWTIDIKAGVAFMTASFLYAVYELWRASKRQKRIMAAAEARAAQAANQLMPATKKAETAPKARPAATKADALPKTAKSVPETKKKAKKAA